jgi:hypothetical protein
VRLKWLGISVLALFLGTTGLLTAKAFGQDRGGWDAPPRELRDVQRQGFLDGIQGARRDVDNHRRPDVNNRDEYRNPSVPRGAWEDYRQGFRRGYETAMAHLNAPVPPPAPARGYVQDNGGWNAAPREFNEVRRQGFLDGIQGAQRDMDNHRRPDVNNRDEYRHPNVRPRDEEDYRIGFRRGYETAMSHMNYR